MKYSLPLYDSEKQGTIYRESFEEALKKAGLEPGDSVFIHSDLKSFGKIACDDKETFLKEIYNAFMNVLGPEGTLIVPTFTYSWCGTDEVFDLETSQSKVGLFSEYIRTRPEALRSIHPLFSCAAIGRNAKEFIGEVPKNSFGSGSIFDILYKRNAKLLLLGTRFAVTFLHYIEKKYGVDYRYIKTFKGRISIKGDSYEDSYEYYVRDTDRFEEYDMTPLGYKLKDDGLLKRVLLGDDRLMLCNHKDAFDAGIKLLKENEYVFAKNIKNCDVMKKVIKENWDLQRDIVSDGFDQALDNIREALPKHIDFKVKSYKTGTKCWTWTVPEKWSFKRGYVFDGATNIIDSNNNPLHVMSYSLPIDKIVTKNELLKHIHTDDRNPDQVPFNFKYYGRDWGFCMAKNDLKKLTASEYKVKIDSSFEEGLLKIGEITIPGKYDDTVVLTAHLCHPHMVNDDLTGVAVIIDTALKLSERDNKYTYRILLVPETIGTIVYLSQNPEIAKKIKTGMFLEMLGNENDFFIQLTEKPSEINEAAKYVLKDYPHRQGLVGKDMSNDEIVYNSPGVDIPVISLSRWPYKEYHSTADNPSIITIKRLAEAQKVTLKILDVYEKNYKPKTNFTGPLFLSGHGLWIDRKTDKKLNDAITMIMMKMDGKNSILEIANSLELDFFDVHRIIEQFRSRELVYPLEDDIQNSGDTDLDEDDTEDLSVGTDVEDIRRMEDTNREFLLKVFTEREILYANSKPKKTETLTGLFAAKEAVYKALFGYKPIESIADVEIIHDNGKPKALVNGDDIGVKVSIAHSGTKATAVAIYKKKR